MRSYTQLILTLTRGGAKIWNSLSSSRIRGPNKWHIDANVITRSLLYAKEVCTEIYIPEFLRGCF